jgi:hypothetical protein
MASKRAAGAWRSERRGERRRVQPRVTRATRRARGACARSRRTARGAQLVVVAGMPHLVGAGAHADERVVVPRKHRRRVAQGRIRRHHPVPPTPGFSRSRDPLCVEGAILRARVVDRRHPSAQPARARREAVVPLRRPEQWRTPRNRRSGAQTHVRTGARPPGTASRASALVGGRRVTPRVAQRAPTSLKQRMMWLLVMILPRLGKPVTSCITRARERPRVRARQRPSQQRTHGGEGSAAGGGRARRATRSAHLGRACGARVGSGAGGRGRPQTLHVAGEVRRAIHAAGRAKARKVALVARAVRRHKVEQAERGRAGRRHRVVGAEEHGNDAGLERAHRRAHRHDVRACALREHREDASDPGPSHGDNEWVQFVSWVAQ